MTRCMREFSECVDCGRSMVAQQTHRKDPDGWRDRGVVRRGAGNRCGACNSYQHRTSTTVHRRRVIAPTPAWRCGPLSDTELVRLRRLVGVPDTGPDTACRARWASEEARP